VLIEQLEIELQQEEDKVALNDLEIYRYFKNKADGQPSLDSLNERYQSFLSYDKQFVTWFEVYARAIDETQFIQVTTPFAKIIHNLSAFKATEKAFKAAIAQLLAIPELSITADASAALDKYITNDLIYFEKSAYNNENLDTLYAALNFFVSTLNENYLLIKLNLLRKFEELELINQDESVVVDMRDEV
jgi:hypothetical protein